MGTQQVTRGDFSIALLQAPASEPVTLDQAKDHLRIPRDVTDFDDKINLFLLAARSFIEHNYGVRCLTQKIEITFQQFPPEDRFRLPVWPVQSVDYFTFEDSDGNTLPMVVGATGGPGVQLLTRLKRKPTEICLPWSKVWPTQVLTTADPIRIGLTVGWNPGGSPLTLPLPAEIVQAICLMLSWWWEQGAAATLGSLMKADKIPLGVDEILHDVKLWW